MSEKREFQSGVTSTKQVRLSLVPHLGLLNAAVRFELGLLKHKEKSWNNLSPNQEALQDIGWLIERASHSIEHAYKIIDQLKYIGDIRNTAPSIQGDAGAIAWAGLVLGEAFVRNSHYLLLPEDYLEMDAKCNVTSAEQKQTTNPALQQLEDLSKGKHAKSTSARNVVTDY